MPRLVEVWVVVLSVACLWSVGEAQTTVITSGGDFVSTLVNWASGPGGDLLLQLQASISLVNSSWSAPVSLPVKGIVSIQGQQSSNGPTSQLQVGASTVLDCAMKSDLTVAWDNLDATLSWKNVVLVNMCSESLSWKPDRNWYILTSQQNFILPRSRLHQTQTRSNVTYYGTWGEVLGMVYWQVVYHLPFDDMRMFAITKLLDRVPPVHSLVAQVTPYNILMSTCSLPGGLDTWLDYRATNNPADPLRLPSLGGPLQPHRFCNGSTPGRLLTADEQAMNATMFPIWVPADDEGLQAAVGAVARYSLAKGDQDPPPVVMVTANLSMPPASSTLRSDVVFQGPFNQVPGFESQVLLNMTRTSLDIASAHILVANLTLTGLASKPLPGTTYLTALPIWAVVRYSNDNSPIRCHTVALVVPQSDYAALLSAALRGPAWQSAASSTAPLLSGVTTFVPNQYTSSSNLSMLLLETYVGWGVNATRLSIVPVTPLTADYLLPDPYTPPASPSSALTPPAGSGSSGLSSSAKLGIGIGVGVGGGLLLLMAALLAWRKWSRRRTYLAAQVQDPELAADKQPLSKTLGASLGAAAPRQHSGGPGMSPMSHTPRELIHRAVSQAQEAIASSATTKASVSANGALTPQALSVTVSAAGAAAAGLLANGTHGVSGGRATSGTSVDDSGSTNTADTGGVNGSPLGTAPVGGMALVGGTQSSGGTAAGLNSPAQQSSGDAATRPVVAGSGKMDPLKAVMAKAGTIQKSDADKLTLLSVLGRGAWGTVYKGTWRGLTVAVKTVLFSEREDGDTTLPHERAIMEAAVCTSVAHRNVVATYHYDIKPVRMVTGQDEGLVVETADNDATALGITDWKLFLVQEWCNSTLGQALRSWLLHKKPSREPLMDLLLDLLLDVAAGIQYLHDKNIIHGDLKPENVMLKTDSSAQIGVVAKITDFGLSTTLGPQATHVSNYKSGTPFYVAPEVTAQGRTTKASDTYSMGVLMWEAYCCMPPWIKVGGEYQANTRFPTFPLDTPRPFVRLAKSCLARDIKQRPSFQEIVTALQGMLDAWQAGYDSLVQPAEQGAALPVAQDAAAPGGPCDTVREGTSEYGGASASIAAAAHAGASVAGNSDGGPLAASGSLPRRTSMPRTGSSKGPADATDAGLKTAASGGPNATLLSEWVRSSQPQE